MNKWMFPAMTALALLNGCASVPSGSIPVVDAGTSVSNSERISNRNGAYQQNNAVSPTQEAPQDSGVVVMVPKGVGSAPIQSFAAPSGPAPISTGPISSAPINSAPGYGAPINNAPINTGGYSAPAPIAPSGIPRNNGGNGGLSADEQLSGPVLALLTTAQQQQTSGDLNGASSSLERAQRIAPSEPQVLYRLAQVRLAQGDAAQAEQFARRALSYASGRPDLQASLWNTIAQAREKQGDPAGAAEARRNAGAGF